MEWDYMLAEYEPVRLCGSEEKQKKLCKQLLDMEMRMQEGRDATSRQAKEDCQTVLRLLIHQTVFWLSLAAKIKNDEVLQVSAYEFADAIFPENAGAGAISEEYLCRMFHLPQRAVIDASGGEGALFLARRHERIQQLQFVSESIEVLSSFDVFAMVAWILNGLGASESDLAAKIVRLSNVFFGRILRVAFACTWIWKVHLRERRQYTSDQDEKNFLWRCALQLYGLLTELKEDDTQVCLEHLPGLFSGNISGTVNHLVFERPILDMTLEELWATWSAVVFRTPGIMIGEDYHRAVHLLVLRCGTLATRGHPPSVLDMTHYVTIPSPEEQAETVTDAEDVRLTINDTFMTETERIFYYLLEASWTTRWLTPRGSHRSPRATHEQHERWIGEVEDCLSGRSAPFVQIHFEKRGWWRVLYWDEMERFQVVMRAHNAMPRQVLGDFRQPHSDAVYQALRSSNTLKVLWQRAIDVSAEDEAKREVATGGCKERGWVWRLVWDVSDELKQKQTSRSQLPRGIIEYVDESSGEVLYIHEATRTRVRGRELAAILLSRNADLSASGRIERNVLEELALTVIMMLSGGPRNDESQSRMRVIQTYELKNHLSMLTLLSGGTNPPHKHLSLAFLSAYPLLLSHHNRYFVLDRDGPCAASETLLDALLAWCITCERVVCRMLNELYDSLHEDVSSEVAERILADVERHCQIIPPLLRRLFQLERDSLLHQPIPDRYRPPELPGRISCAWDQAGDSLASFFLSFFPDLNTSRELATLLANKARVHQRQRPSTPESRDADDDDVDPLDIALDLRPRQVFQTEPQKEDAPYFGNIEDYFHQIGGLDM